jgi:AcrR family transcriptional regulator
MTTHAVDTLRGARPRRGAPQDTRARLVAAAAELFNRHGYHRVDSNRIAHAAGYAAGTFYKHFADKRAAFLAAYEAWVTREWTAIDAQLRAAGARGDAADRIVALVLRHHTRWRGLRASMAALLTEDPEVRAFHRAQRRRQLGLLAAMRARTREPARAAEEDALLLFWLERVCDAVASGEVRDLGLDRVRVLRRIREAIAAALPAEPAPPPTTRRARPLRPVRR